MQILFLALYDPFESATGPGAHLRGLAQSLGRLGCDIHILVLDSNEARDSKKTNRIVNGVQMHHLNPPGIPVAKDLLFSQISSKEVARLCRAYRIDVIHGQSPSSWGYGLLRRHDIPFVVTLHGTSFGEFISYLNVPFSFINRNLVFEALGEMLAAFLTKIEYKCADKVIAVSKAIAEETVRFYRLPREHVETIHNGIDLSNYPDNQAEEGNKEHTILSVGRLSWRKGYKYLVDAMPEILSECSDARLLLVGVGSQKTPLQQHIRKLGVEDSVVFLSKISARKLSSLYNEAGVYVQPSLYEPCAITILEAMSMRRPIVATFVGGFPEVITNEVEGLLVEPGNSQQLARAITRLFLDPSCRKRFGANARKRVEREFTWEAIAKKTLGFYTNLLNDM